MQAVNAAPRAFESCMDVMVIPFPTVGRDDAERSARHRAASDPRSAARVGRTPEVVAPAAWSGIGMTLV